jgi:hypothetical protein
VRRRGTVAARLARVIGASTAMGAIALAGCADESNNAREPATTTTIMTTSSSGNTSIDRSAVPPGAAPGDGSGQGKTPEGNSNSGDSPASSR